MPTSITDPLLKSTYGTVSKRYVYSIEKMAGALYVEQRMNAWVPMKQVQGVSPRYVFSRPGVEDHEYGLASYRDSFRKFGYSSDKQLCFLFDNKD